MEIYYIHMFIYAVYTVCFQIPIVSLNMIFSHYFHGYTEISQNIFSWKFGLKSRKSPGNLLVNMCMNPNVTLR